SIINNNKSKNRPVDIRVQHNEGQENSLAYIKQEVLERTYSYLHNKYAGRKNHFYSKYIEKSKPILNELRHDDVNVVAGSTHKDSTKVTSTQKNSIHKSDSVDRIHKDNLNNIKQQSRFVESQQNNSQMFEEGEPAFQNIQEEEDV